jgi:hypothetical protein
MSWIGDSGLARECKSFQKNFWQIFFEKIWAAGGENLLFQSDETG